MTDTQRKDLHEEITNKIIAQMEKGAAPWQRSWNGGASFAMPMNANTQHNYKGINIPLLWMAADEKAYDCQEWGSYQQWSEKKQQVKKGEKGTMIVFYKTLEKEKDGEIEKIPMIRHSHVFNRCQLEGYKPQEKKQRPLIDRLENVEQYIANTGANIYHDGGNRAYYNRTTDDIHLPVREAFKDTESLYSVTLHEITHWSGAPQRLNRTKGKRFGDKEYAFEELIAELGAALECSALEICNEPREDHAAYLESWLEVLKEDKKAIFTASSEASKAVEYLDGLQNKVVEMPQLGMRVEMENKWYHGGAPNLTYIKPSCETGAACGADYGAEGVTKRNKVYCTRSFEEALIFAAMFPTAKGMVYEVVPEGEIASDPDYLGNEGDCIECDGAAVVKRFKLSGKVIKKIQKSMMKG